MIRSFRDRDTEDLFGGRRVGRYGGFERQAMRRLQILDSATQLADLNGLPGNRFEPLRGNRKGQYSIRVNDQWRICFTWEKDGAHNVEIVDYH
jgi:proteic killer suppression protein